MMSGKLHRRLVRLHPIAFRRRFEDEMLLIFDEAADTWGVGPLLCDAGVSLARQWLLRSGLWKVAAACIGGTVPLVMGFGSFIPWPALWSALCSAM